MTETLKNLTVFKSLKLCPHMYLVTTYVAKHTKSNSSKKVPPLFRVCQGLPERHCAQWGEILSEISRSPDPTTNSKTMNPNIHELFYQSK